MNGPAAYAVDEFWRPEEEIARLQRQAVVIAEAEEAALDLVGLPESGLLLDLGCGPGFVLARIRQARPAISVIGLDRDPTMLRRARAHARAVGGDAATLPFSDATFDGAHVRLVLRHLPSPAQALVEVHRVLRPDGRIVVIDSDDGTLVMHPLPAPFARVLAARQELFRRRGADPFIARRLPALLIDAGFTNVTAQPLVVNSVTVGRQTFAAIVLAPIADALDDAALPREALQEARDALQTWARNEHAFGMTTALVIGGGKG